MPGCPSSSLGIQPQFLCVYRRYEHWADVTGSSGGLGDWRVGYALSRGQPAIGMHRNEPMTSLATAVTTLRVSVPSSFLLGQLHVMGRCPYLAAPGLSALLTTWFYSMELTHGHCLPAHQAYQLLWAVAQCGFPSG